MGGFVETAAKLFVGAALSTVIGPEAMAIVGDIGLGLTVAGAVTGDKNLSAVGTDMLLVNGGGQIAGAFSAPDAWKAADATTTASNYAAQNLNLGGAYTGVNSPEALLATTPDAVATAASPLNYSATTAATGAPFDQSLANYGIAPITPAIPAPSLPGQPVNVGVNDPFIQNSSQEIAPAVASPGSPVGGIVNAPPDITTTPPDITGAPTRADIQTLAQNKLQQPGLSKAQQGYLSVLASGGSEADALAIKNAITNSGGQTILPAFWNSLGPHGKAAAIQVFGGMLGDLASSAGRSRYLDIQQQQANANTLTAQANAAHLQNGGLRYT